MKTNIRLLIFLLILSSWCTYAFGSVYKEQLLWIADDWSYVRELTNRNDNPEIDDWLKFVGLDNKAEIKRTGSGYSYCMAYVQSVYRKVYVTLHNQKHPLIRSARCSEVWKMSKKDKYSYTTMTAKQIYIGAYELQDGDIAIWSHKKINDDFNGHTGLVVDQINNNEFRAIEGNTVPSNDIESQREQTKGSKNQGGVYYKNRKLALGTTAFPVEGFIRVNK